MDLNQRKLTKAEWNSIEIPVSRDEKEVLDLILNGADNVNIFYNKYNSLISFLKIDYSKDMEDYLYTKYFAEKISTLKNKNESIADTLTIKVNSKPKIKKGELIRMGMNEGDKIKLDSAFEYVILDHLEKLLYDKRKNKTTWLCHYFTLYKFLKTNISNLNRHVTMITTSVLELYEDDVDLVSVIEKGVELIEKNTSLLKYADMTLYDHQRKILTLSKHPNPKLILYIAPTGTGKTLSPIGMSCHQRIIFVCAARHVGLALAKSAISVGKKIAFAFGCSSADDIRLHYFAAKEYTRNRRSGGIGKVDNSIGDKVEIMICDIKSYLPAMYYMLAFNDANNMMTYWDEPTITMDYDEHSLHPIINKNWCENAIPNMVLSSATLPKYHELTDVIASFRNKFGGADIHNIVSHDCKKSIPILNKNGRVVLPHYLSEDYDEILKIVSHCEENLTLLRYFDLKEVIEFIMYVETNNFTRHNFKIARKFSSIDDVTMQNIKIHYLLVLKNILPGTWGGIYLRFKSRHISRLEINNAVDLKGEPLRKKSTKDVSVGETDVNKVEQQPGIYVTTKDAFTLTDGPTIFLAENVEKVAKFCIQQANIPAKVMEDITEKIEFNNKLNEKIDQLEREMEDLVEKHTMKEDNAESGSKKKKDPKVKNITGSDGRNVSKIETDLDMLRSLIKSAQLHDKFVPNKVGHVEKWAGSMNTSSVFTSDIDELSIIEIMTLKDVADSWKVLLLMGIGVFTNHPSIAYTEIMKKMADAQRLYMIIASSDYIYGTNYQFCHGYLSKDLSLTQEKIIQALGRIGRNNIQQDYTIRLRDDEQIKKLFYREENKTEVRVINSLFSGESIESDDVVAESDDVVAESDDVVAESEDVVD